MFKNKRKFENFIYPLYYHLNYRSGILVITNNCQDVNGFLKVAKADTGKLYLEIVTLGLVEGDKTRNSLLSLNLSSSFLPENLDMLLFN